MALAEAAGVNVSWLAQGEGDEPDLLTSLRARIRLNRPELAGNPNIAQFLVLPKEPAKPPPPVRVLKLPDVPTEFIGFRHDWLRATFGRDPGDLILEVAVGESMEPDIRNGDLLLVDTTDRTFRNFGVYVIEARGERLVKRVQRKFDGSLILISDNTVYQPELISPRIWRKKCKWSAGSSGAAARFSVSTWFCHTSRETGQT